MSKLSTLRMYMRRPERLAEATDLYTHRVKLLDGGELDLADWRGHPTLIVNTASKCGFTPQYEGLERLYERYHDSGLELLGCPSGDFADQEYEEDGEIGSFCQRNYGVQFPLSTRLSVRDRPDPLWAALISQPGSAPPKWNFTKYLVGGDGRLIEHWGPTVQPDGPKITESIERALAGGEQGRV
ncbi:glutathione peroxidase [Conexibacter sp. S30A1]|uniref:glutathione peroxidase n=1 Tax=Conexibacter sp. S30A1 TaxID=2937800 RepID=UPI00200C5309|nr:glutathione peroxidase [Conexibacter sp. S30A1]